jgi:hypothetical protein
MRIAFDRVLLLMLLLLSIHPHARQRVHPQRHLPLIPLLSRDERSRIERVHMPRFTEHGLSLHDERWRLHPRVLMHHLGSGEFMLFTDDTGVVAGHRVTGAREEESEGDQHDGDEGDND